MPCFQYEVDGSFETHDSTLPSTTKCPYLPGQTVNTLNVPVEQALRQRSASLSSVHQEDFKTMKPESKYSALRPSPSMIMENAPFRLGTAPLLKHKTSTRSLSPAPVWKRIFSRKLASRDGERGRSQDRDDQSTVSEPIPQVTESRCATPSEGTRTRDISPESLLRFLVDDLPPRPDSNLSERPSIIIPDDIEEEHEDDDDDNFATSAASEHQTFTTCLSPPPIKRSASSDSVSFSFSNSGSLTMAPVRPSSQPTQDVQQAPASAVAPSLPRLETFVPPFSPSSAFASPLSPQSPAFEAPSFYDDTDDDDVLSSNNSDCFSIQPSTSGPLRNQKFEIYSLPEQEEGGSKIYQPQPTYAKVNSPPLLARRDTGLSVNGNNFLGSPIDTGLDDFVTELGWIVDVIGSKRH